MCFKYIKIHNKWKSFWKTITDFRFGFGLHFLPTTKKHPYHSQKMQFIKNRISHLEQLSRVGPLVYLLPKAFSSFDFPTFRLCACLVKYITDIYNLTPAKLQDREISNTRGQDFNLTRGCRRFPCLALFAGVWFYFSLLSAVFRFVFVCWQLCTFSRRSCKQCELFPLHVNQKKFRIFVYCVKVIK